MSKPERRSVLTGHLAPGRHGAVDREPVRLREFVREVSEVTARRGQAAAFHEAARATMGLVLPRPGEWREAGDVTALGIGPDSWLLLSPKPVPAFSQEACFVDVGHGFAYLELSGAGARQALAKICRLDLHPSAFRPGQCARTIMAQIPATLWQVDELPTFRLAVPLTFSQSFVHVLLAASAETGCEVLPAAKDRFP